ncbi:MAG TPA: RagB/SusD family nutrient uptake outer membrane protein [Sunxiuqinia sp.]|nr:RagB/SusD family nutrient uptake outer membrane protein [Sunxiuqinia sp.]
MKKIVSILGLIVLLAGTWGCSKSWLDIKPESEVVLEDFWQNESQVNQVVAACYRSLTEYDCMSRMLVWGELRSDDVTYGNSVPSDMYKMLNIDISPSNGYCQWGSFYAVINNCNNFLHYAPDVVNKDANFTNSKLHSLQAEVLTIRALAYFYLVRTFKEVPWIDQPSIDDAQNYNIAKSPEDTILNHLESDLTTALKYARDQYDTNVYDKGRVTKNAVRALLADIYLWRQKYDKCVQMCDQIVNNPGDLQLVDGKDVLSKVFYQGNSTESIFELQFDDDNQFNKVLHDYLGYYGNENGEWSFPAILVTGQYSPFGYLTSGGLESENDLREKDFLNEKGDKYYVFKYAGALRRENPDSKVSSYFYRNTTANWIVYRLSDIILMKAEALIQLGTDNEEVMNLINMTYMRSNVEVGTEPLKLENYNTKGDLEKLLLRERQRELMFEGKRWFDLMRLARRADSPSPLLNYVMKKISGSSGIQTSKMSVMDALYLPIHNDELKANTALTQNPFYKTTGDNAINQ